MTVRALLDSGPEASFVSERVAQQLRLLQCRVNVTISGLQSVITGVATHVSLMVGIKRSPSLRIVVPRALKLARLTALIPGKQIPRGIWSHLQRLQLADLDFDWLATVDAMLGADVYGILLEGGFQRVLPSKPVTHSTVFGWVLMGALFETSSNTSVAAHHVSALSNDIRRS